MIKVTATVRLPRISPRQVADWLSSLNSERYQHWHRDHRRFEYLKKTDTLVGSCIYIEETIGGVVMRNIWDVVAFDEDRSILLKAESFLPTYLRMWADQIGDDTEVTSELMLGLSQSGLARLCDWFLRRLIVTQRRVDAIRQHAVEELEKLQHMT